ncbi:AAA family ATPase [Polyangium jinanense]|uniref:AAA family ATPase n=1 Tax=Polyangium jinanense TaxID=2829994 RepID=A0A9X3X0R7_9BACT|nr:AAA family ATPase [Polyangium jinanense]MDC3954377.1 AAA family ATPase [Polyangium jinanense]MDC3980680.1 AAA family ATPase [Polyangium jinanense]
MRPLDVPIGVSDFRALREGGRYYVDKTELICDVLRAPPQVLLFPRPRRFGKSLNLSMLKYFLERSPEDRRPLFEGLAVMRDSDALAHFQQYPVIYTRLGTVWARDREEARQTLREEARRIYEAHSYLLTEDALTPHERARFLEIFERRADEALLCSALEDLSRYLHRYHRKRVVILVDEYDAPLHLSQMHRSFVDTVELIRKFLHSGIKDNPHLFKGVLTGILRVSNESIFSGLNNVVTYSILCSECATSFGFTEEETTKILRDAGTYDQIEQVRQWYQGYLFGGQSIFNPWSVLNFVRQKDVRFLDYWARESPNDISEELIVRWFSECYEDFEKLLREEAIEKPIQDHIALRDATNHQETVWSILAMAGYLRAEVIAQREEDQDGEPLCKLSFPNREVKGRFTRIFKRWMDAGISGNRGLDQLALSLFEGNAERLAIVLEGFLIRFSNHDRALKDIEAHYHIFLMTLLLPLEERSFEVRSNRESGHGRYDVMLTPKRPGLPGVVMEFKVLPARGSKLPSKEKVEATLETALLQIETLAYAQELYERGAKPIHEIAVVFSGKRAWVRSRRAPPRRLPSR